MDDPCTDAHLAELGASARSAWRDEEEAWTRAALCRWQHARTLRDVVHELGCRGDRVAASTPSARLAGRVIAMGADVVVLDTGEGTVDVVLGPSLVLEVHTRARAGGRRPSPTTLRARLVAREARGAPVVLGTALDTHAGRLSMGADHVRLEGGGRSVVVGLDALSWVRDEFPP